MEGTYALPPARLPVARPAVRRPLAKSLPFPCARRHYFNSGDRNVGPHRSRKALARPSVHKIHVVVMDLYATQGDGLAEDEEHVDGSHPFSCRWTDNPRETGTRWYASPCPGQNP